MKKYYGSLYHSDLYRLKTLTRSESLIYCVLISHGGKDRKIKLSQGKIAGFAGVSLSSAKRALKKFERNHWIVSRDYFQIKLYLLTIAENEPEQGLDPAIGQIDDPAIGQSNDPHVLSYKNNINSITCMDTNWSIDSLLDSAITKEEIIFVRLFQRWSACGVSLWSTPQNKNPLQIWREIAIKTSDLLDHVLEIKIIDSWLLMHRADKTGKHWRKSSWIKGVSNWLDRQVKQGSRTTPNRLSARQKGFYDYSISEFLVPDVPDFDLENYRRKRELQTDAQVTDRNLDDSLDPALIADPDCKKYVDYLTDSGRFSVSLNWMQIFDRARAAHGNLTAGQFDSLNNTYPILKALHKSLLIEIQHNWR